MTELTLKNLVGGEWKPGEGEPADIVSAVTGETVARTSSQGLDFGEMVRFAREEGGPALRAMTIHKRAYMLKDLAAALTERKEELYALNSHTGATRRDGWIDIEGGTGTLFSASSKARRELPDGHVVPDGDLEMLSKTGTWVGQHVYTSLKGVAVHINAFNFPVWGMLEKLGPTLVAGMPAIVKPATATAYLAELAVRIMQETGVLPDGALQLIVGSTGDLFDHLTGQDVVSFTGSAATAAKLKSHPTVIRESVRFIAEQDSLNASVLGPDAGPDSEEFALFIREVVTEMTTKAGQKCTAIRRAMVPARHLDAAEKALAEALAKVTVGDPSVKETRMGALVSLAQREDVREKVATLAREARIVFGDPAEVALDNADGEAGAFLSPVLLRADEPWKASRIHDTEAFGPVATLMPYRDLDDALALCRKGEGSLVMSLFTNDPAVAREVVLGAGSHHGRIAVINRTNARESTGHGSPLPVLVHGGPGRAGGGEEMGGVRGVKHYMQRTAVQGDPDTIAAVIGQHVEGARRETGEVHPFRKKLGELEPGYSFESGYREVTLEDIEHFAEFTGDNFYAHMDEEAAAASPVFGGRVAHGYLILSFAAGLFVDPAPGPVLANTGLDNLRFVKPLKPGDRMKVALTVKSTSKRSEEMGQARWAVRVTNQDDELVASYELLTMNEV